MQVHNFYITAQKSIFFLTQKVQVYLDKSISDHDVKRLEKIMTTRPYIRSEGTIENIKFVSKETAAEIFVLWTQAALLIAF